MKETHVHPCSARRSQRPPSILASAPTLSQPLPDATLPPPSPYPPNLVVQKDRDSERGTGVVPVPALPSLSWPENSTSRIPGHSLPPPAPAIQQSAVLLPTGCPAQRHTPPPPLTPKQTPASSIHEDWVGVGVRDSESPGTRGLRESHPAPQATPPASSPASEGPPPGTKRRRGGVSPSTFNTPREGGRAWTPRPIPCVPRPAAPRECAPSGSPTRSAGCTHDGHAGFAQVAVLLLQRLALEFVGLQLDLQHLVLLLQRGQAVGELLQAERRDDNAPRLPAAAPAAAARGRRAGRLHGCRAAARRVGIALARAVRHGGASGRGEPASRRSGEPGEGRGGPGARRVGAGPGARRGAGSSERGAGGRAQTRGGGEREGASRGRASCSAREQRPRPDSGSTAAPGPGALGGGRPRSPSPALSDRLARTHTPGSAPPSRARAPAPGPCVPGSNPRPRRLFRRKADSTAAPALQVPGHVGGAAGLLGPPHPPTPAKL